MGRGVSMLLYMGLEQRGKDMREGESESSRV